MGFYFLKIFLRGLELGANYIFIDEACFELTNKNFKAWRKPERDFFCEIEKNQK